MKSFNLIEITQAFEALREPLKNEDSGNEANVSLFSDLDLSLNHAMALAWLMNHKDKSYSLQRMSKELCLEDTSLKMILNDLFAVGYLEIKGDDLDVVDCLYFMLLERGIFKACKMEELDADKDE